MTLVGAEQADTYVHASGRPQTSPGFCAGLRGFERADASVDVSGTMWDGKTGLDNTVRTFAGVLRRNIVDALRASPTGPAL